MNIDRPVYRKGDVLRIEDTVDKSTGQISRPTTRFMIIFAFTKTGIPVVAPLNLSANGIDPEIPPSIDTFDGYSTHYKNAHWAPKANCWQVYGRPVTLYKR